METANIELKAELDQPAIKIEEMGLRQESMKVGYRQLRDKYKDLENAAVAWQREKTEVEQPCLA
jgi:hypothetical protein